MKLFQFALIVCLAIILYPGVFFTLPKKGPFSTTCLMHALLFTCMFLVVNHLYYTYVSSDELLEGARDRHRGDHKDHDHHHDHRDHDHHHKDHDHRDHHHDHRDHDHHHKDHDHKIHELEKKERRAEHRHDEALVRKYKQEIRTYSDGKQGTHIEHAYGLLTPAPTTAAAATTTAAAATTTAATTPAATTRAATTTPAAPTFKIYNTTTDTYLKSSPNKIATSAAYNTTSSFNDATSFYFDTQTLQGRTVISSVDNKYFIRLFGVVLIVEKTATELTKSIPSSQLNPLKNINVANNKTIFKYFRLHDRITDVYTMKT